MIKLLKRKVQPSALRIEASSLCQLKCPCCPHSHGLIDRPFVSDERSHSLLTSGRDLNPWEMNACISRPKPVGLGGLSLENFKRIINNNPQVTRVELSNWGEMFLNPQLSEIMAYAHSRHVMLTADNGVNLNSADLGTLEALAKYRFGSLSCSLNGATNETYKKYSIGGDLETVLGNISKIILFKRKYKTRLPILHWQFVIFGHNEHEMEAARKKAGELGMYFIPRLNLDHDYSPVKNSKFIQNNIWGKHDSRVSYFNKNKIANRQKMICAQLWNTPQINWDGRMLGCCVNYWDDFGNVLDEGVQNVLNNEKMGYSRAMLLGKKPPREDVLCTECNYYKIMKNTGNWLTLPEIYFYKLAILLKYESVRILKWYPLPPKYSI